MKDPETVDNTTIRSIILEQNKKEVLQLDRDRIPNIVDNAELLVIGGEGKAVLGLKIKLPDGSLKILLVADVEVNNRLAEIWNELSPFVKMYEIAAQTPPEEIKEIPEVMEKKDYLKI
ncbi:MAG: hypothetical protein M1514_00540 [Patescibacteria group bacterium]|nr:hypothetical protein [Patescibacteria group bacterium]